MITAQDCIGNTSDFDNIRLMYICIYLSVLVVQKWIKVRRQKSKSYLPPKHTPLDLFDLSFSLLFVTAHHHYLFCHVRKVSVIEHPPVFGPAFAARSCRLAQKGTPEYEKEQ